MQIFHYHETSGLLLGSGDARPDPLAPAEFLIPAFATALAPPHHEEGEQVRFENGGWIVEAIPAPPPPAPPPAPSEEALRAAIEAEAQRRSDAVAPIWKQIGMLRAPQASDPAVWEQINAIRTAAEAMKADVATVALNTLATDPRWP